jgi:hypothetical protein
VKAYNTLMSRQHHYYGANHLHYLTKSIYRRVRVFDSDRFRLNFTGTLDHVRAELGFKAQQPREAPAGGAARRLALVELEVLPSGGCVRAGHGPDAVIRMGRLHQEAT